jgi:hypothetical protein
LLTTYVIALCALFIPFFVVAASAKETYSGPEHGSVAFYDNGLAMLENAAVSDTAALALLALGFLGLGFVRTKNRLG